MNRVKRQASVIDLRDHLAVGAQRGVPHRTSKLQCCGGLAAVLNQLMDIVRQIELGAVVCPKTRERLRIEGEALLAPGGQKYPFRQTKVPILVTDRQWLDTYSKESSAMSAEYESADAKPSLLQRIKASPAVAYRSAASRRAMGAVLGDASPDRLLLSVGGGPTRAHPLLTNLNIGPFPNVDIVADGHELPYADSCVDGVHCEAVFEHLYSPVKAAAEIVRVMKPGAKAFICTPFLQAYHGYPHHYQNYTATGQAELFRAAGLKVLDYGPCVGPAHMLADMISQFLREYAPLNKLSRVAWGGVRIAVAPLVRYVDKRLTLRSNGHMLASTTYLLAEKP